MRITHEADYAIRVVYCLAYAGHRLSAKEISEQTGVTQRFALKILRKLIQADLIQSFKGVSGGYILNRTPDTTVWERLSSRSTARLQSIIA